MGKPGYLALPLHTKLPDCHFWSQKRAFSQQIGRKIPRSDNDLPRGQTTREAKVKGYCISFKY